MARAFYVVDPLDRWVRLTWLAETYKEPLSSIRDFLEESGVTIRKRGNVHYANERAYQEALAGLPEHETSKRGNIRDPEKRPDPLPGRGERQPRLRKSQTDQAGSPPEL